MSKGLENLRAHVAESTQYSVVRVPSGTDNVTLTSPANLDFDSVAAKWMIRLMEDLVTRDAEEAEAHELGHLFSLHRTNIVQVQGYETDEGARLAIKISNVLHHVHFVPLLETEYGISSELHISAIMNAIKSRSEGDEALSESSPYWLLQSHGLNYYELVKQGRLTETEAIGLASWSECVLTSLQMAISNLGIIRDKASAYDQMNGITGYICALGYCSSEVERVDEQYRGLARAR